jgi:hypothetical protein
VQFVDFWINLGIGLAGLVFTLVSFAITWRYTVVARDRRVREANEFIVRAVLKRMVLDDFSPTFSDLTVIIDGAAQRYDVRANELMWEEELVSRLMSEALDNDLIGSDQRQRMSAHLQTIQTPAEVERLRGSSSEESPYWWVLGVVAGLAAIVMAFLLAVAGIGTGIAVAVEPTVNRGRIFGTLLIFGMAPGFMFVCYAGYRKYRSIQRHEQRRQAIARRHKRRAATDRSNLQVVETSAASQARSAD